MISLPLEVPDGRKDILFPNAVSNAYTYHNGYIKRDTLFPSVGYWLKFTQAETIDIVGSLQFPETVSVRPRWNMIGSPEWEIYVDDIVSIPGGNIISQYYEYIPGIGYEESYILKPGKSYWVKANGEAKLIYLPPVPETPEQIISANGITDQPLNMIFNWSIVKYASMYHFQVATDSDMIQCIVNDSTLTETVYLLNNLECGQIYY